MLHYIKGCVNWLTVAFFQIKDYFEIMHCLKFYRKAEFCYQFCEFWAIWQFAGRKFQDYFLFPHLAVLQLRFASQPL
jgi:hypothetical protein